MEVTFSWKLRYPPPNYSALLILSVLMSVTACAANGSREPVMADKPLPGGSTAASTSDEKVKLAAQRAVAAHAKASGQPLTLVSIEDASRQVVAGVNYHLRLSVMKGDRPQFANAVVWGKLDGSYELTAWSWE
jgi:hypothetical protein